MANLFEMLQSFKVPSDDEKATDKVPNKALEQGETLNFDEWSVNMGVGYCCTPKRRFWFIEHFVYVVIPNNVNTAINVWIYQWIREKC